MIKQFWSWFIRIPPGLDWADKVFLYGQYVICVFFALHGPLFVAGAIFGDLEVLVRLALLAAAVAVVAIALGLRILIFWIYTKRVAIQRRLGL